MDVDTPNTANPSRDRQADTDLLKTEETAAASACEASSQSRDKGDPVDQAEPVTSAQSADLDAVGTVPRAELEELNDRHLRLAAEFENYKKRTTRQWQERVQAANADLLYDLLDIVDNFERALAAEHELNAYADGVRLIYDQLQALLERQGVRPIVAMGERFDPAVHEALLHVASADVDEGRVCQEIRRGYRHHDRVLRPAQVAVSRGRGGSDPEASSDADEAPRSG